jgi:hypothetical protein
MDLIDKVDTQIKQQLITVPEIVKDIKSTSDAFAPIDKKVYIVTYKYYQNIYSINMFIQYYNR